MSELRNDCGIGYHLPSGTCDHCGGILAGEDKPADEQFAKSLGIQYHRRFRGDKWIANVIATFKGHDNHIFVEDITRGDLRRLLRALGITTKEASDGQ